MSSLPPTRGALLRSNATSLIPDAHEIELAAQSQSALRPLAEATGDLTVVLSGEGGSTGEILIPASAVRLLFAALACDNRNDRRSA